jgi:prolyl-tRNA synthetase
MADADGKMKDLSISETGKKKDGNPKKAPKEKKAPQAQKKKIEGAALIGIDVAKEADLAEWYQQVITKGYFLPSKHM